MGGLGCTRRGLAMKTAAVPAAPAPTLPSALCCTLPMPLLPSLTLSLPLPLPLPLRSSWACLSLASQALRSCMWKRPTRQREAQSTAEARAAKK